MKKNQSLVLDVGIILVIYFVFLLVQTHSVGRAAFSFTDEGVYLYAAKLITQGYVPYRDFFLGHFPFLIYANAAIMLTVKSNMIVYHWVYTAWTLSLVIPLYFTIKKLTENRSAAVLSLVVLAGFTEMMQWDMHYFAIRQASLPFLAWALLFLTYRKLTPTAFLLALFSICLATNIVLSVALVASYLLLEYVFNRKKLNFREFVVPALMFLVIVGSQFLILWLIPNGIKNVLGFQIDRGSVGLLGRFSEIIEVIPKNWPIFLFGLAGIFACRKNTAYLAVFSILAVLSVLFLGSSFYPQYIVILSVGFTVLTGMLFARILNWGKAAIYPLAITVIICVYWVSYSSLRDSLINSSTPDFFAVVATLENLPGPVFAYEPIYELYAKKEMTFNYNVSDMRHLLVLEQNLSDEEYINLLEKSNSVLIEPTLRQILPAVANDYIKDNFSGLYQSGDVTIYTRLSN